MEVKYSEELGAYFLELEDAALKRLEWEEGDMLDYEIEDDLIRFFKI